MEHPFGTAHVPTLQPHPSPLDHHPPVPNDHHEFQPGEHQVGVDQHERGAHQPLFQPQPQLGEHGEHQEFHEPMPMDTLQLLPLPQLFQFDPHQLELLFQLQLPPPFQFPPPPPFQLRPPPPPPDHDDALELARTRLREVRSSYCEPAPNCVPETPLEIDWPPESGALSRTRLPPPPPRRATPPWVSAPLGSGTLMRFGRNAPELAPPELIPVDAPGMPDDGANVSVPLRRRREVRSPVFGTVNGEELCGTPDPIPEDAAGACPRGRDSPCAERCGAACAGEPAEDAALGGGP